MILDGYALISNVIKCLFTLRHFFGYLNRKGSLSWHSRTLIWLFKQWHRTSGIEVSLECPPKLVSFDDKQEKITTYNFYPDPTDTTLVYQTYNGTGKILWINIHLSYRIPALLVIATHS